MRAFRSKKTGQWLTYSITTTHTGRHGKLGHTDDINKAFAGYPHQLPFNLRRNGLKEKYESVEVVVKRTVEIV